MSKILTLLPVPMQSGLPNASLHHTHWHSYHQKHREQVQMNARESELTSTVGGNGRGCNYGNSLND